MSGPEILHTERLVLRRLHSASEIAALLDLWTDPEVTQFMGGPRNREDLQADFEATLESPNRDEYDLWPLLERDTLRVVGHCGLLHKDVDGTAEIEVVYVIARSEWGQGYASEIAQALVQHAFRKLELTRAGGADRSGQRRVRARGGQNRLALRARRRASGRSDSTRLRGGNCGRADPVRCCAGSSMVRRRGMHGAPRTRTSPSCSTVRI